MAIKVGQFKRRVILEKLELAQSNSAENVVFDVSFTMRSGAGLAFKIFAHTINSDGSVNPPSIFITPWTPNVEHRINMLAEYGYNPLSPVSL